MIIGDVAVRHSLRALKASSQWKEIQHGANRCNHHVVRPRGPFRLAIIGSGPAGFYSAYKVMSRVKDAVVDMYEQLPVPFGLVRFGVAPDHPEVKNCQDKFTEVASSPNFNFIGNVEIGRDLPLSLLRQHYDAFLFAYGASKDRSLNVPGEETLNGIYSARAFVGWYNGLPEYANLSPKLDAGEDAVIIGQGNVALDVARTLMSDVDRLVKTDITEHALSILAQSKVKRVRVVGRRGPMQASFTIKEVRELMTLPGVGFEPIDASLLPPEPARLPRAQKRMVQLLQKGSSATQSTTSKSWSLNSLLSPIEFTSNGPTSNKLQAVTFAKTSFQTPDPFHRDAKVQPTSETVSLPASLAFRSIGYKSEAIPGMSDLAIPFDDRLGIIPNAQGGRIIHLNSPSASKYLPGMYCTGWVKNGPTGVIASTMEDAFASAEAIAEDWENRVPSLGSDEDGVRGGWEAVRHESVAKTLRPVSWEDWQKIDAAERERGRRKGKEREKFVRVEDMLKVLE